MQIRSVAILCLGATVLGLSFGAVCQTSSLTATVSPNAAKQRRQTPPEAWWMHGRRAPHGQSVTDFLLRAHEFKSRARMVAKDSLKRPVTSLSVGSGWRPIGPAPLASDASGFGLRDYNWVSGRATAVAIDPADVTGNTIYLGGAYGGLWKSSNAGAPLASEVTWTPLLDDQATLAVGSIAIQPGGTGVILVGTGEADSSTDSYYGLGILRSADDGKTWTLVRASVDGRSFQGMGFGKIAFSRDNPALVVAAAGFASQGVSSGLDSGANRGIYTSSDAGVTWRYASIKDGAATVTASSVTSVEYNATSKKFVAVVRRHGFYSSSDGMTWTRLMNQPGSGAAVLNTASCPPDAAANAFKCPIYRGEIAVVPGRDEVYSWFVDLPDNRHPEADQGIWRSVGGGPWTQLSNAGLASCGDASGCGAEGGDYALTIAAVPNGSVATDLYAGAVNLYRCPLIDGSNSINCSGNSWLNLTHAYGCSEISRVHPNQHAMQFSFTSGQAIGFFANDGGIYRVLDGFTDLSAGLNGSCSGINQFDSLNETLGSITQIVSFAQHPTDSGILLAGAQANGFPATNHAGVDSSFVNVLSSDGGLPAIVPNATNRWLASAPDVPPGGLNIGLCEFGIECRSGKFSTILDSADLSGDDGWYYPPFIVDPQANDTLLVGTCRIWRAGFDKTTFTQISNNFDTGSGSCTGYEVNQVRALGVGGPKGPHGFSSVIYAGTNGLGPLLGLTTPAGGRVFVSTNADSTGPSFKDVTGSINPQQYPVSDVVIDPSDPTGQTAFITIMGFGVTHVFKTETAGANWTEFGYVASGLPDVPVNTALIDANEHQIYVGTDVGVFVSPVSTPNWVEVGGDNTFGRLPNVPVTTLRMFNPTPDIKKLRASTYGRGLWEFNLIVTPDFQIGISNPFPVTFAAEHSILTGTLRVTDGYASAVTLSCAGPNQPSTCSPNPTTLVPTESGTDFIVTTSGEAGIYEFNIHASGTDERHLERDAAVTLKIVDYKISDLTPNAVSVTPSTVSNAMTFILSAAGPFDGIVSLSCPSGLPAGATCNFSPSNSIPLSSAMPVPASLVISTADTTPTGTFPITVQANVLGAPSPKTTGVIVNVTAAADFGLTVSNSPLSLSVGQQGEFVGRLFGVNGYSNSVQIACGTGAPPTCIGGSFIPTLTGTEFRIAVGSSSANTYRFDFVASGGDSMRTKHSVPVQLNTSTSFNMTTDSGIQIVKSGGTAWYALKLVASGGSFTDDVTFSCASSNLPPLSRCMFDPASLPSGSNSTTVRLSIATTAPSAALEIQRNATFYAVILPFLAIVCVGVRCERVTKRSLKIASVNLVLVSTVFISSCGGGFSEPGGGGHAGTPVGSYNVRVSATCGSMSRYLTVTLVVE